MIKLSKLFEEIKNDKELDSLSINEQIDGSTYIYLAEILITPTDFYSYISEGRGFYTFIDRENYKHFDRLVFNNDRWELKLGYFDKDTARPVYDRPKIYKDLKYDEKVFNTHLKIVLDELIPYFFERTTIPDNEKILYLPALDVPRYRLYKIALLKFIDTKTYKIELSPEDKLIIIHKEIKI